jgi:plasmid segregation protein ParM
MALKPYIQELAKTMKLRFSEDSELQNVYGYLKMAKNKVNQSS